MRSLMTIGGEMKKPRTTTTTTTTTTLVAIRDPFPGPKIHTDSLIDCLIELRREKSVMQSVNFD